MIFVAGAKGETMSKYIDRDMAEQALIKEAALILRKMPYIAIADSVDRMIKIVQDIPAADVAPVVHGRWIEKTAHDRRQYFECSNCGKQENKHTAIRGGFCWNCGAKMDKEE